MITLKCWWLVQLIDWCYLPILTIGSMTKVPGLHVSHLLVDSLGCLHGSQRGVKNSKRWQIPTCKHSSSTCLHPVCYFSLAKVCHMVKPIVSMRGDDTKVCIGQKIIVAISANMDHISQP